MTYGRLARRVLPRPLYDVLAAVAFRSLERRIALRDIAVEVADGPPLPTALLRVLVTGDADGPAFLQRGRRLAEAIERLAGRHGFDLSEPLAVLEWGCGCGRIARWIAPRVTDAGGRFTGADLNAALVDWCEGALPGHYVRNGLRPPLPFADGGLDFAYAYSVVTHLSLEHTRAWLAELARVLRPGALAVISFHDEDWPCPAPGALEGAASYINTRLLEGSNHMAVWIRRDAFHAMAAACFDVLEIVPSDLAGELQAWAVLRKPRRPGERPARPEARRA